MAAPITATNDAVLMIEPALLLEHVGQRGLAAQVDRGEVDLLHPPPRVEVGVEDRVVLGRADPGVVERDVDRAVGVLGGPEERVDLVLVRHVDVDVRRHVGPAELVRRARAPAVVGQVADDDLGALGDEPAYGRQADARAASGDDRDPVLDPSCHVFSPVVCQWAMKTFFSSVNAMGASGPSSRPRPDCL